MTRYRKTNVGCMELVETLFRGQGRGMFGVEPAEYRVRA